MTFFHDIYIYVKEMQAKTEDFPKLSSKPIKKAQRNFFFLTPHQYKCKNMGK